MPEQSEAYEALAQAPTPAPAPARGTLQERERRTLQVSWVKVATAIATTIVTSYPFFAIVSSMAALKPEEFVSCTQEACQFTRLFSTGGLPGIYPDIAQVQNGVRHPVVALDLMTRFTPVVHGFNLARWYGFFLPPFLGVYEYQWMNQSANIAQYAYSYCAYFVCVGDDRHISIADTFFPGERVSAINERMRHDSLHMQDSVSIADNETVFGGALGIKFARNSSSRHQVEQLKVAASKLNFFIRSLAFGSTRLQFVYSTLVLKLFLQDLATDIEVLPYGRCSALSASEMKSMCDEEKVRKHIRNPMFDATSTKVYLCAIMGWASGKAIHDALLLKDFPESITISVGMVSLFFQGVAVSSGLLATVAGAQVFLAPVNSEDSCRCYYKLDDIAALLLLSTPLVLFMTYFSKKKRIIQSCICGDYLYYEQYDVPFRMVRQNPLSDQYSLLTPVLSANHAGSDPQVLHPSLLQTFDRFYGCSLVLEIYTIFMPFLMVVTILVPRAMRMLVQWSTSDDQTWSMFLIYRLALSCPLLATTAAAGSIANWKQGGFVGSNREVPSTSVQSLFESFVDRVREKMYANRQYIIAFALLPFGLLLLPPPQIWTSSAKVEAAVLNIYSNLWQTGSFWMGGMLVLATTPNHLNPSNYKEFLDFLRRGRSDPADSQDFQQVFPHDEEKYPGEYGEQELREYWRHEMLPLAA